MMIQFSDVVVIVMFVWVIMRIIQVPKGCKHGVV